MLCLVCGLFGERWAKICETFGLKVERLKVESGQVVPLEELRKRLLEDKDRQIKAVTITHNETSTGVINDLKQLVLAIREHGALSIVDAVTSFAVVPISFSDWGIDVLVSGSQKALMLPPGLACIFMSQKAWKAYERSTLPKFYLNLGQYRTALENETTPYTPNVSMIVALKTSLDQILLEGISSIYTRHERMRRALRTGLVGMGLKPLVHESHASPTITAVLPPTSISVEQIRRLMNERYQLKVADGQDELKNKIFRIGHMGYVFERDILMCLAALEVCLTTLGHRCPSGIGVGSAITELTSMTSVLSK